MTDAHDQEVALDVLYPSGFYPFQTPLILDYVAALNGVPLGHRSADAPFTYLDLGCGDGFTIVCLAAIYPESRFVGIDLNPRHIEAGRALAAAGGLSNVELIEGRFEDWRSLDLPPRIDYAAMHGVYAWIGEAARRAILDLVADRLAEGGLLYVSYNALPGWAAVAPLRQYFLDYTRGMGPDAIANVAATLAHLKELRAKGAEYFIRNPTASGFLDELATKDVRYVAHEIYSPHWSPLPFSAVSAQMRGIGLSFAGSADLAKNFARSSVRSELYPLVVKERNRERAELYRDYANNTFFRRDVFVRRPEDAPREDPRRLIAAFPFGSKVPGAELGRVLPLPTGPMPIEGQPFEGLRRALARGTRRLPEIAEAGSVFAARFSPLDLAEALQVMSLGLQVAPFARPVSPEPDAEPIADWAVPLPLNRRLLAGPVASGDPFVLAVSPSAGTVIPIAPDDGLVLLAVAEAGAADAAGWAWDHATPRKRWLHRKDNGRAITERGAHRAAFAEQKAALAARLPKWIELGVIAPR
jgi:SAM-dependent methyltransferase